MRSTSLQIPRSKAAQGSLELNLGGQVSVLALTVLSNVLIIGRGAGAP